MKKATVILSILLLALCLGGCDEEIFSGSRKVDDSSYQIDFEMLNGERTQVLSFQEGDELKVDITRIKGSIKLSLTSTAGQEIYSGDCSITTNFTIRVPKTGEYVVSIVGKKAQGSVRIEFKPATGI